MPDEEVPTAPTEERIEKTREWARTMQETRRAEAPQRREEEGAEHARLQSAHFLWWEKRFGRRVREWRTARSWSQEDLAERLRDVGIDMHQTTLAKLERGGRPLRVAEAVAIATIMGMPALSVFYGPGPERENFSLKALRESLEAAEEGIRFTEESLQAQYRTLTFYESLRTTTAEAINRAALETDRGEHPEEA